MKTEIHMIKKTAHLKTEITLPEDCTKWYEAIEARVRPLLNDGWTLKKITFDPIEQMEVTL